MAPGNFQLDRLPSTIYRTGGEVRGVNWQLLIGYARRQLSRSRQRRPRRHGRCDNLSGMENFYARSVFFVKDAEESLNFYPHMLGFSVDWNHQYERRAWVFQVSLFGFELILNQVHGPTQNRAGHGRTFIGLEDDQSPPLLQHIRQRGLNAMRVEWGRPTLVLLDPDGNELFFWIPDSEWANLPLELPSLYT